MTTPRPRNLILLSTLLVLVAAGCGMNNPHPMGSYDRAWAFQQAGKHQEAVDAYGQFLRRSPTDSLAALAQFHKAAAYVDLKEFPLAVVEYRILRQEYPTSALVEEAMYRECEARFLQVGRIERDITSGHEARDSFLAFLQTYPTSPWRPAVEERLVDIADIVVRKQLKSVDLYRRMGKDESAAIVLDRLLETERKSTLRDMLFWERAETARELEDADAETTALEGLLEEFPDSDLADDARRRLGALQAPSES